MKKQILFLAGVLSLMPLILMGQLYSKFRQANPRTDDRGNVKRAIW